MTYTRPTVYIPTLNAGEPLRECLRSLALQTESADVVVADNSSSDSCRAMLDAEFPWATRVGLGTNLGFGSALNKAIAAEGTGPIILLNDDAVADPGFVAALMAAASSGVEMVAAVLVSREDHGVIDSAGILVDDTAMGYDHLSGKPVADAAGAPSPMAPTGGGALYSREAFDAVGGFDESIFLYYEDLDLGMRIRANGGRCVPAPEAAAAHVYSQTLGANSPAKYRRTGWSRGYVMRVYGVTNRPGTAVRAVLVEAVVCFGQLLRSRTFQGLLGRVEGWRAGAGRPRRELPSGNTLRLSIREALSQRVGR